MEPIIIALSGRKGSGKNTIAKSISIFFAGRNIQTYECSFADHLKRFCIETLGLSYDQCYGSDEQKNTPTRYLWDNAFPFLRWKFDLKRNPKPFSSLISEYSDKDIQYHKWQNNHNNPWNFLLEGASNGCVPNGLKSGPMTAREIMQLVGTDLVRETFGNIWADATIAGIKSKGVQVAIITDNRFPNEIESVLCEPKGYIVRLTRSPYGFVDMHPSESSLDNYDFNKTKCFVLNNDKMTLEEQNEAVTRLLNTIVEGVS